MSTETYGDALKDVWKHGFSDHNTRWGVGGFLAVTILIAAALTYAVAKSESKSIADKKMWLIPSIWVVLFLVFWFGSASYYKKECCKSPNSSS